MSSAPKAVFLSYASQDAEAARRICDALRATGVEVWFDQSELRGGDAWDASIRRQIKECALFVPVISANTQSRSEGYFRLEWKLAVDRSHLMADDQAFLLPVVIDATLDANARVPDKFRDVQWTRLPAGEASAAFAEHVHRLLSGRCCASSGRATASGVGDNTAASSRTLVDRGAAVRQPQPRRGRRVLLRRPRRRAAQRAGEDPRAAGGGAHLGLHVQGQGAPPSPRSAGRSTSPRCSKAACARRATGCASRCSS